MSVYARTGSPSRPGSYWVTAIKDGEPHSLTGKPVFYVCDDNGFNVLGLLFHRLSDACSELVKIAPNPSPQPPGKE